MKREERGRKGGREREKEREGEGKTAPVLPFIRCILCCRQCFRDFSFSKPYSKQWGLLQ